MTKDREHIEFELVRLCSRTRLKDHEADAIRALVSRIEDWTLVIRLARRHGVFPLVHRTLTSLSDVEAPAAALDILNKLCLSTRAFNIFLVKELSRITQLLNEHGIPVLCLKGPVMARVSYGNLSLRPSTDLDLLIPPRSLAAVEGFLLDDGYLPFTKVAALKSWQKRIFLWETGQYPFYRGNGVYNLDVHTRIMPPLYRYSIPFDDLHERSSRVTVAGDQFAGLGLEDMILVLCYHGAKNRWETLKYICDVAELMRHPIDWDQVLSLARQTRGEHILHLGLSLAHTVRDQELPGEVLRRVQRDTTVGVLSDNIARSLPSRHESGITPFDERFRFHLKIQDTLINKARYLLLALLRRSRLFVADVP